MHPALVEWGKRPDMVVHDDAPLNCEPPPTALADDEVTAVDTFYCRNHGPIPAIAAKDWRLMVGGAACGPMALTYAELTRLPARDVVATLQCAGNRRAELLRIRPMPGKEPWAQCAVSTAVWHGARLAEVLQAAGIRGDDHAHVAFTGVDESPHAQVFGGSIPLSKALSDEVLLAWRMNGEPLPRIHGGPVRVVVPGFIGARSVKWLTGITVQPTPSSNYFQAVDYRVNGAALSTMALTCAILTPGDGARIAAGPLTIHGYAIAADCRHIARVEVSLDGGAAWQRAELTSPGNAWTWRHWTLSTTATLGPLTVTARAFDDTDTCQPESAAALWNPGGYANNSWAHATLSVQPRR